MAESDDNPRNIRAIVSAFLAGKKIIPPPCPVCGTNDWIIDDQVSGAPLFNVTKNWGLEPDPSAHAPYIALYCSNCWYVLFFAWMPLSREMERRGNG